MALVVFGCAALVLISAWWVVTLRNLFRAALSLGLALVGVAGLFLILQAEFLAFVQILVYVGAILTLVIFAIMLTSNAPGRTDAPTHRQQLPAGLATLTLFGVLTVSTAPLVRSVVPPEQVVDAAMVGQQFITTLLLPFEVISLVCIAAVVGAIAIAAVRPPNAPRA